MNFFPFFGDDDESLGNKVIDVFISTTAKQKIILDGSTADQYPESDKRRAKEIQRAKENREIPSWEDPASSLAKSFYDNVFSDPVCPRPGSLIHCALYGVEHTGIYVGRNRVVELLGTGRVEKSSPQQFIQGTNAVTVYVACADGVPILDRQAAARARLWVGRKKNYKLLDDNCHRFSAYCISGVDSTKLAYFYKLEKLLMEKYGLSPATFSWRRWSI